MKTGDFQDLSLVKVLKAESPFQADIASLKEFMKEESMTIIIPVNETGVTTSLVHRGEPSKPVTLVHKGEPAKSTTLELKTLPAQPIIATATSPKGKEIKVTDLEAFCKVHNLDLEAVQAVLEGEQKTHKRWRFTKA
ncbi:hypothetical protein [Bacillus thuringiensis]|uniref:hypothetical protein n=1 Tax=Bacillus thuringiensis TaxID=1428 RepID=UPI001155689E|nr:hypothetical protein [Bacillus thuringiensis]